MNNNRRSSPFKALLALALTAFAVFSVPAAAVVPVSTPTYAWHTFQGGTNSEGPQGIATDSQGNIIMVGYANGTWSGPGGEAPLIPFASGVDMMVIKLDSAGNYKWHAFLGGSSTDFAYRVAVDANDNIFVAGYSLSAWNGPSGQAPLNAFTGNFDIMVAKLNSAGAYQWHTFYGGTTSSDVAQAITVDSAGNVVVAGHSSVNWNGPSGQAALNPLTTGGDNIVVLKLDNNGGYLWHTYYAGGAAAARVAGVRVDSADNVVLSGYSITGWNGPGNTPPLNAANTGYNINVIKLNAAGAYQWHTFYGGNGGVNDDWALDTAVDAGDNVIVVGYATASWNGPGGQAPINPFTDTQDILVLKLNSAGTYQWHTFHGGVNVDTPSSVAVDAKGNVIVTGYSYNSWNGPGNVAPLNAYTPPSGPLPEDIVVVGIGSDGTYQWHSFYGSSNRDFGRGVAVDKDGNYLIAAESPQSFNTSNGDAPLNAYSGGGWDIVVIKLLAPKAALPAAPVVTTPGNGSLTGDSTPTVAGTAPNGSTVKIYVDNSLADTTTADASGNWSRALTSALGDGWHEVYATATDAGNSTSVNSNTNVFFVDTAPPGTSITVKPTNPSSSTSASFSFTGNDGAGSGVASFECALDGGGFSACTSPKSYSGLAQGAHTFLVRAIDNVGLVDGTPASHAWVVDTLPPDTSITNQLQLANPTNSTSVYFSFEGSDTGGTSVASFQCSLDGGAFSACSSPQGYSGLADGSHTFRVRAVDAAGNPDATPASFDWRVDTTAPGATINRGQSQATPTNVSPIVFDVVFSETVTGFDGNDISFAGSTAGGTLVATVSGAGPQYTVSVTGMTTAGTVVASIPSGSAFDLASNPGNASTSSDNVVTWAGPYVRTISGSTGTTAEPISISFTGGSTTCTFSSAEFLGAPPASAPLPPFGQYVFPHGLVHFAAKYCGDGATLTFAVTYPHALPADTHFLKYGPTAGNPSFHWYDFPATISGNTATFAITDGGLGDDDLTVDGNISDAAGPAVPVPAPAIPALGDAGLLWLGALLLLTGAALSRRRGDAAARRRI